MDFTAQGPVFHLGEPLLGPQTADPASDSADAAAPPADGLASQASSVTSFSAVFDGAHAVSPTGLDPQGTTYNYYVGDPSTWRSGVATYSAVAYLGLYDGIDLKLSGDAADLKYEFDVAAGGDWRQIAVTYQGIDSLSLDGSGNLQIETAAGTVLDEAPTLYQTLDGQRVSVAGQYRLIDADTYGFTVTGPYDPSQPLVIDPALDWATYVGGSGYDCAYGIAVDNSGNTLVAGSTASTSGFTGATNTYKGGSYDAFVAKMTSAGSVTWETFLGGTDTDVAAAIAVDGSGNALVAGYTYSSNFAGAGNALKGPSDGFVAKVTSTGALAWATYLGGSGDDQVIGIAADGSGNALVAGVTSSSNFPGATNAYAGGAHDAFVAEVTSATGSVSWSTYLGGTGDDQGTGIAMDGSGNLLVAGETSSSSASFTGATNTYKGGSYDAFVAKVSPTGSLSWATYLGGASADSAECIVADGSGNALVAGYTQSTGFVGANNAYGGGWSDAFVAKVNSAGSQVWATYLGGNGKDEAFAIAQDAAGNALVAGYTESANLPQATNAYKGGVGDGFVAQVASAGSLAWATYLGGSDHDTAIGIALDGSGNARVAGLTQSSDFVGTSNAYRGGVSDAFVLEVNLTLPDAPINISPANSATGISLTPILTASAFSDPHGYAQAAAEWVITRTSDNTVVWDSGTDASDLTSCAVPSATLAYSATYSWRVRYKGLDGFWGGYSTPTSFTTGLAGVWAPLITFPTWDQSGRINGTATTWNQYCPLDPYTGTRSVTGCVATAEAQVLYYWQSPLSLSFSSSDSYTSQGDDGPIRIDADSSTYNFPSFASLNASLATITYDGSPNEEALLSFAVGIKTQMSYASTGSGAMLSNTTFADFGYESADQSTDWGGIEATVIANIEAGQPVLLAISDATDAHAVVLDGYNSNNNTFHVDLGWGPGNDNLNGNNDWYLLPNIDTFTNIDVIVYNIEPILPSPGGEAASQGAFTDHVHLTWNTVPDAVGYEVWRSVTNDPATATEISSAGLVGTSYDDYTASNSQPYYYWVKSTSQIGASSLGSSVEGSLTPPPLTPTNIAPANGQAGATLTPTLSASAFSDPGGHAQVAAEWVIRRSSDNALAWDSGSDTSDKTHVAVPSSTLAYSTVYTWQVRYVNADGVWSAYSTATSFTTLADQAPSVSSVPVSGSITITENATLTFSSSQFAAAFSDPNAGDSLRKIMVTSLPGHGTLTLNGTAVTVNQEIAVGQLGNLKYTPDYEYHGTDGFGWNGSDGTMYAALAASATWKVNADPTLGLSDITMVHNTALPVTLGPATNADGVPVTYTAAVSTVQAQAGSVQQQLNLAAYWAQYNNLRGWNEKYLTDASGQWFYMLPTGALYAWDGSNSPTGNTLKAELDAGYYQDPSRLVYSTWAGWTVAAEASAFTLEQAQGFTAYWAQYNNLRGWSEKYLTDASGQWFYILPTGTVYEWNGANTSTGNTPVGTLDMAFYQDPSRLVHSWAVTPPASSVVGAVAGTMVTLSVGSTVGPFVMYVTATDGVVTVKQYVWVTVTNSAPVLALTDISMLDGDTSTLTLGPASDADGDAVSYTAAVSSTCAQASSVQQQLNLTAYWAQYDNARLWGEKYLTDAAGNWYYILSTGALYKWAGSSSSTGNTFEGQVDASYYQDPSRLVYASFTGWSAANEAAAYTLEQAQNLTGYWAQYNNARGWGEKYLTNAAGQWYYILPTGALYEWNGGNTSTSNMLIGTLAAAFYQDPSRLVHSWSSSPPASGVVGAVTGTSVTITPGSLVGRFLVCVTATDGIATTRQYVWVTAAPKTLAGLSSIGMTHGTASTITLGPATSGGNPITYTATVSSAQGQANDIQQRLNVTTYWAQYNGARGWGEKYLTDALGQFYYILPTGALYKWNGINNSTLNTLIATLDVGYYQDPRRLIYANWTGWSAAAEVAGSAIQQAQGLTSYWAQYNNARGWNEKYLTDASGHWYYILPTGALYEWNGSNSSTGNTLIGTVDTLFYQDPSRLACSWAASTADPSVLSVTGTDLTITPGSFTGQLLVCVTSTAASGKQYVWLTVS